MDEINKAIARDLQRQAISRGKPMHWVVCSNPSDYPGKHTARPHSPTHGAANFVLVTETLDDLRALLPPGLSRVVPGQGEDPVILEFWLYDGKPPG
jgi:hypothetical protein